MVDAKVLGERPHRVLGIIGAAPTELSLKKQAETIRRGGLQVDREKVCFHAVNVAE